MKRMLVVLASIFVLLYGTIAYGQSYTIDKNNKVQQVIVLKNGLTSAELTEFAKRYKLNVNSITFNGSNFSCGGTVESIDEINLLVSQIISNWEGDLKQDKIPDNVKNQIKQHIQLTREGMLKATSVSVIGDLPVEVKNHENVLKIVDKKK